MRPTDYFDDDPEEEIDIYELRKTIRAEFMRDLETAYVAVSVLPKEIQLEALINIMLDI